MPQVIAGTASDLTNTIAELVKNLLETNWPTSAYDPLKSEVDFGLDTWNDYGDIDIMVNADKCTSQPATIGWTYSAITESVTINLFVRKNTQAIPSSLGSAQRKIESIIKDNAASLGQGVTAIRFDGWDPVNAGNTILDVWKITGRASAIFFRVKQ